MLWVVVLEEEVHEQEEVLEVGVLVVGVPAVEVLEVGVPEVEVPDNILVHQRIGSGCSQC